MAQIESDMGDNIIRTKDFTGFINPNGVAHEIYTALKKNKDKRGQIEATSGISETYGTILERAIRVACHLRKLGVIPEDIISPCTTNHLNTSVVFYAILFTGAKPACMDPNTSEEEKRGQLLLVKPKYIFATPETVADLERIIEKFSLNTEIVVFGETEKHICFQEFLVPLQKEESDFKVYSNKNSFDTALIAFSSGTTGVPKGICITHYQILAMVTTAIQEIGSQSVYMSYVSLVWLSALVVTTIFPIQGHTKIMCSNFELEKTWKYLDKYRVTHVHLLCYEFNFLVKSGKPEGLELPYLKTITPGGGTISTEILLEASRMFPTVFIGTAYSQTELWGFGLWSEKTITGLSECMRKPGMVGKPIRGLTYKIVDPETEEVLGPNKPGELRVKTKMIMNGYYNEDSSERFDSQGFLKTGDVLYYDEDHRFFFVERLKETLKYRMVAVSPTELEGILLQHPSVQLAVVLGLPSDEGDLITAVVVKLNDGVTAEELENLVASKVDDVKRLRGGVRFVDRSEIPFTPSGKIKRGVLRQYIMAKN